MLPVSSRKKILTEYGLPSWLLSHREGKRQENYSINGLRLNIRDSFIITAYGIIQDDFLSVHYLKISL